MAKPFIQRLILDKPNLKIVHENKQDIGGLGVFRKSFFGQLFNNVKTNWLMLLFCIPVIAWIFICHIEQVSYDMTIPYSGNIGIGYPVINDAHIVGAMTDFDMAMKRALIMMPLIIVGTVGLAGVFNVIKYFCWGFNIKIGKTFFRGIKNSYASFVWVGMMLAICFILITFVLNVFKIYPSVAPVWQIVAYIGCIVFCVFVLLLCVFITTQAAVFNLTLFEILKNSFHLGTRFIMQNALILVAGMVSMVLPLLTFNSYVQIAAYVLFFLLAFSWTATVWTIYCHSIYDLMYIPDEKQPGEGQKAIPHKTSTESRHKPAQKQAAKPYRNPKKTKKSN